jgi:2-oxoglutarate ferredoxin oxidoreductase subunit gamma
MVLKTIFAGFGGQGVLSMGLNLSQAAMLDGKHVTYLPAYGAEVRGGTANCTVAIADEEIASPVASSPDFIVAMNQPSLVRFQNKLQTGGIFFLNASLVTEAVPRGDVDIVKIPVNDLAEELGNSKCANMIMLGALIKKTNLVSKDALVKGLHNAFKNKKKLIPLNEKALTCGFDYVPAE